MGSTIHNTLEIIHRIVGSVGSHFVNFSLNRVQNLREVIGVASFGIRHHSSDNLATSGIKTDVNFDPKGNSPPIDESGAILFPVAGAVLRFCFFHDLLECQNRACDYLTKLRDTPLCNKAIKRFVRRPRDVDSRLEAIQSGVVTLPGEFAEKWFKKCQLQSQT